MQPEQSDAGDAPEAVAVARFLTANPEFFERHHDILPRLSIPHASGRAVSLIERQVSVLRGKCASLEGSLRDLIGVARANERLQSRLHALVQEIISAPSLDVLVAATRRSLCDGFGADAVHVLLVAPPGGGAETETRTEAGGGDYLAVDADDPRLARFEDMLAERGTRCGLPDEAQLRTLVGEERANVGSAALIPLFHERALGLIMLTSRDESRFGAGKGVVFLDQLGEVLSRRLHALERERS